MRQKLFSIVLCGVFLLAFFAAPGYAAASDVFQRCAPSVATLVITRQDGKEAQGTGFLISSRGEVLTNYHVVDGAESIGVYFSENLWYSAKRVIAQDPEKDLALLTIDSVSSFLRPLSLNQTKPLEGSDLIVIGTPIGLDKTITTGILSSHRSWMIQFSAPVTHGSSGSPVLDTAGKVVGMVIGGVNDAQGVNFAVGAKEIDNFLKTRPFIAGAARPVAKNNQSKQSKQSKQPKQPKQPEKFAQPKQPETQKSPQQRPFPDILAALEIVRPESTIGYARQKLGPPAEEEELGRNRSVYRWRYPEYGATLFVWERSGRVDHSVWVEYYKTMDAAKSRAEELSALASQRFGKPVRTSRRGAGWRRGNYVLGVEQHSRSGNHMLIVNAEP